GSGGGALRQPCPRGRTRGGHDVVGGAASRGRVPCSGRRLPQDALDEVVLVRRPVADGLRFAHLGERFLAFLGFDQLDRGLDGLADLGSHRLRGARAGLLRERARGEQGDPAKTKKAKTKKARAGAHGTRGAGLQRRNCSLPIRPIFFNPRRCAEAITIATLSYLTSLLGRRCTSG